MRCRFPGLWQYLFVLTVSFSRFRWTVSAPHSGRSDQQRDLTREDSVATIVLNKT